MKSTLRSLGISLCAAGLLLFCAVGLAKTYSPTASIDTTDKDSSFVAALSSRN